ncbi:MAG: glucose-6-phosphate isomerase family protein, partial [Clostridia bacterium]
DSIRKNLMNPECSGPDIVYSIAMDVGNLEDRPAMLERNLLYGTVTYAKGQLGREPVRSQGHIHAISPSCGSSTCELYEIWSGSACIYMQETAQDNPGRCFAVMAKAGETVIVPPGWAHCTIVADTEQNMTFGAWCVRDFGFDYTDVRKHGGVAWFPVVENKELQFVKNPQYTTERVIVKSPRLYTEFGLEAGKPIYTQFQEDPDRFLFVSKPQTASKLWLNFIP